MRYVADDGTEFETEKECLEHECLLADIESSFIMYDERFNKLSSENYESCHYVSVLRRALDVSEYLYNQYGFGMYRDDMTEDGFYIYDDDGCFKSVSELFRYHCEQAKRFQRIKKKLLVLSGKEDL